MLSLNKGNLGMTGGFGGMVLKPWSQRTKTAEELLLEMGHDWDAIIATNLTGPFLCIRPALRGMIAKRYGRIINMASIYSTRAVADRIDYVTTKTAIVGLTRAVAIETTKDAITADMPTVKKNSPSSRPLNGSMSVSSS